jgi:hypothetical protein
MDTIGSGIGPAFVERHHVLGVMTSLSLCITLGVATGAATGWLLVRVVNLLLLLAPGT